MSNIDSIIKSIQAKNRLVKELKGKAVNLKTISGPKLPQIVMGEDKVFNLTNESFNQICNLLNIPVSYLINCPCSLKINNINTILSLLDKNTKWNLKIKDDILISINKQSNLKTISSLEIAKLFADMISPDNAPAILPSAIAERWEGDEEVFQFTLIFNTSLFYEDGEKKKGVFPALVITNSETGKFGIKVDFAVFREPTDSLIIALVDNKRYFRGKLSYSDINILQTSLLKQFSSFTKSVESVKVKFEKARNKEIKDISAFLEKARKKYKFDKIIISRIIEISTSIESNSLYTIAFAFAKAVKEQFTGKKRYDYLSLAGVIINDI